MHLPTQVHMALNRLDDAGYEAYIVGGCVRDHLRGVTPSDYDIATSAAPEQIEAVFRDLRVIKTGLQHGTVTVLVDGLPLEITTYRQDSTYSDHRHPDSVNFTRNLSDDLARRDFTINAMAYHPQKGLVDLWDGQADLSQRVIRCVGQPRQRFQEDALRIMRALRFSAVLGFSLEEATEQAAFDLRDTLKYVSQERLNVEFTKLLCGHSVEDVLCRYAPILGVFIPEILPMQGMEQHNPYHIYDVLTHTAKTVAHSARMRELRLAAFFHDIAKPCCFTLDDAGVGHFHGHPEIGAQMTDGILKRLKYDNATRHRVVELVRWHDLMIEPTEKSVRRALHKLTPEQFLPLLQLKYADLSAHNPELVCTDKLRQIEAVARQVLEQSQCFSLRDLAVNGRDLLELGMPAGKELGEALTWLLEAVMADQVINEKAALLHYWQSHRSREADL